MMSKLYPKLQTGGTLSQLGYKRYSPYNQAPSLLINTPSGSITMKEVDHPIIGIGKGEIKLMQPEQEYQFKSNKVLEIPMKTNLYPKRFQQGGRSPKVYTDKNEFLKAKQAYNDSLDLYNNTKTFKVDKNKPIRSYSEADRVFLNKEFPNSVIQKEFTQFVDPYLKSILDAGARPSNYKVGKSYPTKDLQLKTNQNEYLKNELYPKITFTKNKGDRIIDPLRNVTLRHTKISPIGIAQGDISDPDNINSGLVEIYKKPTQPVIYQQPEQPRMPEMTPVQTIQPQVQDTLIQRPVTIKMVYPSKSSQPHVWNTYTPPTKRVERAPGLGGYNRIYQEGGTTPEMSPEQQQEIVRRVRNLRKTIGYNKTQGVPLDGIAFRHALHVNKHLIKQEDQELLSAFDENQILDLMNKVPDEDQPMYKKGGRISSKSKMYPKCKCGCGGVSVGKNKMFQSGGTMDVLDGDGNSQMTITGGERIFSRIATKKMMELNDNGNYTELGRFICNELTAQDKREPQYVKE